MASQDDIYMKGLFEAIDLLPEDKLGDEVAGFLGFYSQSFLPGKRHEGVEYGEGSNVSVIPLYDLIMAGDTDKISRLWRNELDLEQALPLMQDVLNSAEDYSSENTDQSHPEESLGLHEYIRAAKTFDNVVIKVPVENRRGFPRHLTEDYL